MAGLFTLSACALFWNGAGGATPNTGDTAQTAAPEGANVASTGSESGQRDLRAQAIAALFLLAGWGVALSSARRMSRAARSIECGAEGLASGNAHYESDVSGNDELASASRSLSNAMNSLAPVVDKVGKGSGAWEEISNQLRASALNRAIIENAPVNVLVADTEFNITYQNPESLKTLRRLQHLLPISADAIVGVSIDIFHKDPSHQRRMLSNPANLPHTTEIGLGDEILELKATNITDATGETMGFMVAWKIVTEERKAQTAIEFTIDELTARATELGQSAEILLSNSESAAQLAESTAGESKEMMDSTTAVAASTEEMTVTVSSIAQSSRDLADSADQAVQAAMTASELMSRLRDANDQISRVSETISSIADQTNLLALNATIEAAGAGEAGRGFAVVASEVKDLARETIQATGSIDSQVRDIRGRSEEVANSIEEITAVIHKVNDLATTLATAVEEQNATTREISVSISQSAERSSRISHDIEDVARSAVGSNETAQGVLAAARQLSELATNLKV